MANTSIRYSQPPLPHGIISPTTSGPEAEAQKREERRKLIVTEIYTTEKAYVEHMESLVTKFVDPLAGMSQLFGLDPGVLTQIFGNITVRPGGFL